MKEKTWLCMILERGTDRELATYEDIMALDLYYAKHKAANRYEEANPGVPRNTFYVDAVAA